MTSDTGGFDYSQVRGIPEVAVRAELLLERLQLLASGSRSRILEIGVGSGDITLILAGLFEDVTCVDPDEINCNLVWKRLKDMNLNGVTFLRTKVEEAQIPPNYYNHIILQNILEHLEDPVNVLQSLSTCLCPGGYMHISVPLANSLHRWLGVEMGLISHPDDLGETDVQYGHRRVYTPDLLRKHMESADLQAVYELPFYLKPLPTPMLNPLSMEIHRTLYLLGQRFPEFASYMYMEVSRRSTGFHLQPDRPR